MRESFRECLEFLQGLDTDTFRVIAKSFMRTEAKIDDDYSIYRGEFTKKFYEVARGYRHTYINDKRLDSVTAEQTVTEGLQSATEDADNNDSVIGQSEPIGSSSEPENAEPFLPTPRAKIDYVENVQMGTIVAFRTLGGRVKSAKVINKSSSRRVLKLETSYGAQFVVDYDDVIWVRCGGRWPRGVWELLKGIKSHEAQQEPK